MGKAQTCSKTVTLSKVLIFLENLTVMVNTNGEMGRATLVTSKVAVNKVKVNGKKVLSPRVTNIRVNLSMI